MNRLALLVITLWSLWYARNKKVYEANLQTPEQICAFIVSYYRELEFIAPKLQLISSTQNSLWQAPDLPLIKANFDASFSSVDRASWSGVVASSPDLSELSAVIFEVQVKAKSLRNCSFNFTPCASNQVAHIIAKDFFLNSGDRFWVEEIPSSALRAAAFDCRNLRPP
ncbi:hypothetical protein V6N12_020334 [Hibiscus sabdariffa]|uniref:RNase H type-1 domain-containing protein n=1 Tax=Hibiscus sabdariffa TaxID=183260 RepID=A0ABR2B246_9ROSI